MKFRYSMISSYDFCPTKAKLQYIDLIPEPGLPGAELIYGTAIHTAIESHFDGMDSVEAFRMFWGSVDPNEYHWRTSRQKYEELGDTGATHMRKWVKAHAQHYRPLHIEKEMEFEVNGFTITGKPDFIGYYKDKLSIVDWKTSANDFDKRKGLVDAQTWIYVKGAKDTYGLGIEQVVYAPFVKYGAKVQNPIAIPVTSGKLKSMLDDATIKMRDMSARTEWPRNGGNCLKCAYFKHCYKGDL